MGADTTHYLFAHLDQDLLSFTGRLDVTIRPTLSLQLYAEPFVTAGRFTDARELAAPRARSYDARFRAYAGTAPDADFNEKQFNSSAVVRWEYRPGSTLFVVWTQGRDQGDRDLGTLRRATRLPEPVRGAAGQRAAGEGGVLDGAVRAGKLVAGLLVCERRTASGSECFPRPHPPPPPTTHHSPRTTHHSYRWGSSSPSSGVPPRRCHASSSGETGRKIRSAASQIDFENG